MRASSPAHPKRCTNLNPSLSTQDEYRAPHIPSATTVKVDHLSNRDLGENRKQIAAYIRITGIWKRHSLSETTNATFPHRRNPDGTLDSICTQCFQTVATEATEDELKAAEGVHRCEQPRFGEIMH